MDMLRDRQRWISSRRKSRPWKQRSRDWKVSLVHERKTKKVASLQNKEKSEDQSSNVIVEKDAEIRELNERILELQGELEDAGKAAVEKQGNFDQRGGVISSSRGIADENARRN